MKRHLEWPFIHSQQTVKQKLFLYQTFSGIQSLNCRCRLLGIFLETQVTNQYGEKYNRSETKADCQAYDDFSEITN